MAHIHLVQIREHPLPPCRFLASFVKEITLPFSKLKTWMKTQKRTIIVLFCLLLYYNYDLRLNFIKLQKFAQSKINYLANVYDDWGTRAVNLYFTYTAKWWTKGGWKTVLHQVLTASIQLDVTGGLSAAGNFNHSHCKRNKHQNSCVSICMEIKQETKIKRVAVAQVGWMSAGSFSPTAAGNQAY